jgi:enamine deaminase RidA (YjgF/YER057c/UK114 family)/chorismate mutase
VTGRRLVSSGAPWEPVVGYSRAVRVGPWIAVAGTTAAAEVGGAIGGDDAGEQTREALRRIAAALQQTGASLQDVIRTRIFVTDISRWEEIGRAHGEVFADIRPAASLVEVGALIDPALLVEIEADAVISVPIDQNPTPTQQRAEQGPESLAEVRARIDALDDQIVALLALRQRHVQAAALYKTDEEAVRAPDRRAELLRRLRQRAVTEGVDPGVVDRVWTAMTDAFTDLELREHERHRDLHGLEQ